MGSQSARKSQGVSAGGMFPFTERKFSWGGTGTTHACSWPDGDPSRAGASKGVGSSGQGGGQEQSQDGEYRSRS